jgi:3-oxoacyl-[acyl-carrier protein] reductase
MSDFLLTLGKNPRARAIVRRLGLPLPLPVVLRRARGPWQAHPLADARVVVGAIAGARLVPVVAECLAGAGADAFVASEDLLPTFKGPCEAFGRPARPLATLPASERLDGLVFDASAADDPASLRALYDFAHALVGRLARGARIVILARGGDGAVPQAAGAQGALDGFVRSVAKEIGRLGATANLVRVADDAHRRALPVLRFLLSASSAFVSGQPLEVSARAKAREEPSFVRPLERAVALVTGSARGIGAATARALAQEGAQVVCVDRPADSGPNSQLAREIGGRPLGVDLRSPDAASAIDGVLRSLGGVDVIVHNAGVTRDKTLARMTGEQWDEVLAVNLTAVVRLTTALEPLVRDFGRIVCVSSVSGIAGNVGQSAYAASKAGVIGFVSSSASWLAARGITVNAVAPGFIETRMTAAMPVAVREVARRLSALGQGGLPEDVAQAILFLSSPGAQGITGRTLRVCGGAFVGS